MKTCSMQDFMTELKPWLDTDHVRKALLDKQGRLILFFVDGMKNVYQIDDCNQAQVREVLAGLKKKGITVEEE